MRLFTNLSLTKKLTAIIMLTTFTALLLSSAAFNVFEIYFSRKSIQNELLGVSEIISSNVAASLVFDDQTTGEEILSALRKDSRVEHACIFDNKGEAFALFNKNNVKLQINPPDLNLDSVFFSQGKVNLVKPIMLNNERIGTIYIQSGTTDMPSRVYTYLGISLLVLFASSIVAFLLSSKLQRLISVPILNLTKTAGRISEEKNYALRVPTAKGDEIGRLVESFNDMLSNIEIRDAALEAAHEALSDNLEQLEKKNKYETIIGSITRSVHQSIDLQEVLDNAVKSLVENIERVKHVAIYFVEGNEAVMKSHEGYPDWFIERTRRIPKPKGFTWNVILNAKPKYSPDVDKDDIIGPAGKEVGTKSYLAMPIFSEGQAVGSINVHSMEKHAFDKDELNVLDIVARQIETAINNAKQAEALRVSEERFRGTFEQAAVGIAHIDLDGGWLMVNERLCSIVGYHRDELLNLTFQDLTHPDDLGSDLVFVSKTLSGEIQSYSREKRYIRKDGSVVWINNTVALMRDNERKPMYFISVSEDITTRKSAEEDLRESEIRLRRSIMNAPFPIMLHAEDGEVLRINNVWTDITGYTHNEIPTIKDWLQKAYGIKQDNVKRHIEKLFLSDELQHEGEYEIRTSSGQKRIWDFSSAPLGRDPDGRKIVISTAVDITQRKYAEELIRKSLALVEKKSKHENIINTITRSVHQSIDLNEVIDNAVESLSKNIDNTDQVVVFMKEDDFAVIKAQRGLQDWYAERIKKIPYPKGFTWKVIMEGKPIYCSDVDKDNIIGPAGRESGMKSYVSMPIKFEGETVGCVNLHSFQTDAYDEDDISLLDIVAKQIEVAINNAKQAEALRISEERLRSVITDLPVFLWAVDREGFFTLAKGKGLENIGMSEESILGRYFVNVFHDLPSSIAAYEKSLEGEELSTVLEIKGSHFECHHSPIFDVDGKVIGVQGLWVDITERKRMEEEMIKHQKLESIGILAGGIAHDFNNLLTAIMGNISLMKAITSPGDSIYKRLNEAEKACMRAGDLTHQFLTFSKGGAPVKELTSIDRLINDTAHFVLRGSGVIAELNLPDDLWSVEVDKGQFSQVIENLVINASHSMPEGGIINITAQNVALTEEDNIKEILGNAVKVSITDHGVGISKQNLSKIFDPYFTTKDHGSGLGLSMVYSIIKKHGGLVTVDSKIDKGTTFTIYLPATGKIEQSLSQSPQNLRPGIGKILIMDDDESVKDIAGSMLGHLGYEVDYSSDGEQAIEIYRNAMNTGISYDLIIIDLTVPGRMGGIKAIEKLLELDPNVKAVVSSGYSTDPIMFDFEKHGFKGVITKPYKIEQLSRVVHDILNNQSKAENTEVEEKADSASDPSETTH